MRKHVAVFLAFTLLSANAAVFAEERDSGPRVALSASSAAVNPHPLNRAPHALDVDMAVTQAVDRYNERFFAPRVAPLAQRTRTRPQNTRNGGSEGWKWVGVGMMVVGGLAAVNGALSTCGGSYTQTLTTVSVDTHACWGHVAVGAGIVGVGWYLFDRNR